MNSSDKRHERTGKPAEPQRTYQIWLGKDFAGTVIAADERDARIHAARIHMAAYHDVSVLPVC